MTVTAEHTYPAKDSRLASMVRDARAAAGLSQHDLAKRWLVPVVDLVVLESGDKLPRWPCLIWERVMGGGFLPHGAWDALYLAMKPEPPEIVYLHDVGPAHFGPKWEMFPPQVGRAANSRGPHVYVREDVAALRTASMLVAAEAEIDTLSTQSAALAIADMDLMDERDALRVEVAALRGRIAQLRRHLLSIRADATGSTQWYVNLSDLRRAVAYALDEDDAATKGVG